MVIGETQPFHELIYAGKDVEDIIKSKYPKVKIKDASDYIHTERFLCDIEGVSDDEFYPLAIRKGFARCCLRFEVLFESLRFKELKDGPTHKETLTKIKRWIDLADALPEEDPPCSQP